MEEASKGSDIFPGNVLTDIVAVLTLVMVGPCPSVTLCLK